MKMRKLVASILALSMTCSIALPVGATELEDVAVDVVDAVVLEQDETEAETEVAVEAEEEVVLMNQDETALTVDSLNDLFPSVTFDADGQVAAYMDGMDEATLELAVAYVLKSAGMAESQLGNFPYDYIMMAKSVNIIDADFDGEAEVTSDDVATMWENAAALAEAMGQDVLEPLFVNGMAQPIYDYNNVERFVVYVESNYDTDGDGKLDLVKALIQLPGEALEDGVTMPIIYEARPYIAGTNAFRSNSSDESFDIEGMYAQPDAREAEGYATTEDAIEQTVESDYYYEYNGEMVFEDLTWYDYYIVRGYAVVESAGIGTYGSEGFETCGSDLEIDAFACVIEWLAGNRVAYTDLYSNIQISAEDWSNGKVGMTGRSYAGTTQFALASSNIEGLETVVPVAGIASWYEYTNGQGVYNSSATYTNTLAWYCNSRYEHENYASVADAYLAYTGETITLQNEANGDYAMHWAIRDYTLNAEERAELVAMGELTERYDIGTDNISCPALIVHGLNDFNVRTKQSDLMFDAFKEAGQNVKILFHQGQHLTPTYPAGAVEMYVGLDGELITYDELLNLWFSHYLFDIDNGIEDMPEVTVQSNLDIDDWDSYDSWDTDLSVELPLSLATDDVTSDLVYRDTLTYSFTVPEDYNVFGTMELKVTGSFEVTDESITDAIRLDVEIAEADEESFITYPGYTTIGSNLTILEEGAAWMGGGVENFDLVEYTADQTTYDKFSDGRIDLYNPYAGYQSMDAVLLADEVAIEGETYTYTIYMQPTVREVVAGHEITVKLSLGNTNASTATFTVDNTASTLMLPVSQEVTTVPTADVAVQTAPSSVDESAFEVVLNEGSDMSVMSFYVTSEEDFTIAAASEDFAVITGTKTGDTTPVIVTYKNGTPDTYTSDVATTIATIVVAGAGETISISDAEIANTVWENAATISADTATGVIYDVNGDGIVSLADIAFLKGFYGMEPTGELAQYDIDCNGDIGSSDFLTIFFCEAFQ